MRLTAEKLVTDEEFVNAMRQCNMEMRNGVVRTTLPELRTLFFRLLCVYEHLAAERAVPPSQKPVRSAA